MASLTSLIYLSTFTVFFFGQLFRLDTKLVSFPIIDIFIAIIFLINLFQRIKDKNFQTKNLVLLHFIVFAWLSFIFNFFKYHLNPFTPILYLIRLTLLLSFLIYPPKIEAKIKKFFYLAVFSNVIFGLVQYLFWPNFTYFSSLNWDPHLFRLVSTFFDPTFTALIYLFLIIAVFLQPKFPCRKTILIITYIAMALTYSRSTYISFFVAFVYIAYQKNSLRIFFISLILIISTIYFLPRFEGEGTKLERTSSIMAKVQNYQEAYQLFLRSPIIGHGYNNLPYLKINQDSKSHANSAFDGSLMTIITTTGIFGLLLFIIGIFRVFINSHLITKTLIIAVLIHSLFANSLLYPWVLLSLVFL